MRASSTRNSGKDTSSKPRKKNPKKSQSCHNHLIRQILNNTGKRKRKGKKRKERKRVTAAQLNDLHPLADGTDENLQTPHDSEPTSSSSDNSDEKGKGPPKEPPRGNGRGAAPSPTPPLPPIQEEAFAALLAQTLRKTMTQDTGRRLPVKAPQTFNSEFTKFRGWWKAMQRYLRIYASHIPDDTTRINVVSTYLKDDALLWHEARERLLEQKRKIDNWMLFSSKIEE